MRKIKIGKKFKIISVHLPKCGGTSFLNWLKCAFGEASVLPDYDDRPMDPSSFCNIDPVSHKQKAIQLFSQTSSDKRVVHGHFLAAKYDFVPGYRITFLRHPVERALSNYFFWMSVPVTNNKLHEYVVRSNLKWKEFVSLPVINKIYSGLFFANISMKAFDFIGDCAVFDSELQRLGGGLGVSGGIAHSNKTNDLDAGYDLKIADILCEKKNRSFLETCLKEDILFYEKWKNR